MIDDKALAELAADWRKQAKMLRNEIPNLRDGSDKRFDSARDADTAADELEAALAAEGVQAGEVEQRARELEARLAEDRALLDAIRDAMGGGPYDTLPKRIAALTEARNGR